MGAEFTHNGTKATMNIDDSESCLALFTRNKHDLLCQFVTMDET